MAVTGINGRLWQHLKTTCGTANQRDQTRPQVSPGRSAMAKRPGRDLPGTAQDIGFPVSQVRLFWDLLSYNSHKFDYWLRVTKYRSPKNDPVVVIIVVLLLLIFIFQNLINNRPFRVGVGLIIRSSYEIVVKSGFLISSVVEQDCYVISETLLKEEPCIVVFKGYISCGCGCNKVM